MCKTWNIKYACAHTFQFRLSTCRGTFVTQSKPTRPTKPACSTGPVFTFLSAQQCGPCQAAEVEKGMVDKIGKLRLREGTVDGEEELLDALEEQAQVLFQLEKLYPKGQQLKKWRVPEKGKRTTLLGTSGLRDEILLDEEEGEEGKEAWDNYLAGWNDGGGWASWDGGNNGRGSEDVSWMDGESVEATSTFEWGPPLDEDLAPPALMDIPNAQPPPNKIDSVSSDTIFESGVEVSRPDEVCRTIATVIEDQQIESVKSESCYQQGSTTVQTKASPPHLRRHRKHSTLRQKTMLEGTGKSEIELLWRFRCLSTWTSVS